MCLQSLAAESHLVAQACPISSLRLLQVCQALWVRLRPCLALRFRAVALPLGWLLRRALLEGRASSWRMRQDGSSGLRARVATQVLALERRRKLHGWPQQLCELRTRSTSSAGS